MGSFYKKMSEISQMVNWYAQKKMKLRKCYSLGTKHRS